MRERITREIGVVSLVFFGGFLNACTLVPNDRVSLELEIREPGRVLGQETEFGGSRIEPGRFFHAASTLPSDVSSFTCYAVNVSGPGIAPSLTNSQIPSYVSYGVDPNCTFPAISTRLLSTTETSATLDVPAGLARTVQVVGIVTGEGCPETSFVDYIKARQAAATADTPFPPIAQLGKAVVDLYRDTALTIDNVYNSTTPVSPFGCGTKTSTAGIPYSIVKEGLVLFLDASRASAGTPPAPGCAPPVWENLTGTSGPAALLDFNTCNSASGWNGQGTAASPSYLAFNGLTNTVGVGFRPELESNQVSVEVYLSGTGSILSRHIVSKFASGTSASYGIFTNSGGSVLFGIQQSTLATALSPTTASALNGSFHQVVGTFDGTTPKLYLDGALVSGTTTTASSPIRFTGAGLFIGGLTSGLSTSAFTGKIAAVSVYNRVLSAAEVSTNCSAYGKVRLGISGAGCP